MPIDLQDVPGYKVSTGPPDDYAPDGLHQWDDNYVTNVRFGLIRLTNGRWGIRSITRCRPKNLVGVTATVDPGDFDSGWSPKLFPFFEDGPVTHQFSGLMPETQSDVAIRVETIANMDGNSRYVPVSANGQFIGDAFVIGDFSGFTSRDTVIIPAVGTPALPAWNVIRGDGNVLFSFALAGTTFFGHNDWIRFRVEYAQSPEEFHGFANDEVCFPSGGLGIMRLSSGRWAPVTLNEPSNDLGEPALVVRGRLYRVRPNDQLGVGTPGRWVYAMPFLTPTTIVAVNASYPRVCTILVQ